MIFREGEQVINIEEVRVPIIVVPPGTRGRVAWDSGDPITPEIGVAVGVLFDSEPQTVITLSAKKLKRLESEETP